MKQSTLQETQKLFRIVMNSMASPGTVFNVDSCNHEPLIYQICDTLLDNEVTFSVVGDNVQESFIDEIAIRTGSSYVDAAAAMFVIVCGGNNENILQNLSIGSLEYPEKSATVIYMVDSLDTQGGIPLLLSGPGIEQPFITTIDGIPREDFEQRSKLNSEYPLGLDILFCDNQKVLSLPRTTTVVPQ